MCVQYTGFLVVCNSLGFLVALNEASSISVCWFGVGGCGGGGGKGAGVKHNPTPNPPGQQS